MMIEALPIQEKFPSELNWTVRSDSLSMSNDKVKSPCFLIEESSSTLDYSALEDTFHADVTGTANDEPLLDQLPSEEAISLQALEELIDEFIDGLPSDPHAMYGYFRNSGPVLANLALALGSYLCEGDLEATFKSLSAKGQGAFEQPTSVRKTLEWALDPHIHGGFIQTIRAIQEDQSGVYIQLVPIARKLLLKIAAILECDIDVEALIPSSIPFKRG